MHGFFVDIRLYRKAKSVAEPFAFDEYKRKKIREKIEGDRENRVKLQVREHGRGGALEKDSVEEAMILCFIQSSMN